MKRMPPAKAKYSKNSDSIVERAQKLLMKALLAHPGIALLPAKASWELINKHPILRKKAYATTAAVSIAGMACYLVGDMIFLTGSDDEKHPILEHPQVPKHIFYLMVSREALKTGGFMGAAGAPLLFAFVPHYSLAFEPAGKKFTTILSGVLATNIALSPIIHLGFTQFALPLVEANQLLQLGASHEDVDDLVATSQKRRKLVQYLYMLYAILLAIASVMTIVAGLKGKSHYPRKWLPIVANPILPTMALGSFVNAKFLPKKIRRKVQGCGLSGGSIIGMALSGLTLYFGKKK
ncbi:MAG: hypothetical protein Q4P66_00460 [Actinomycetaceae bacterium]|nr:hypothetical protein [Actinomycetaceae bacterium]